MAAMQIPASSTEYVYSTVTADRDLTGTTVEVALPAKGSTPATWFTASVTAVKENGGTWTATFRILIGPSGVVTLTQGSTYDWWAKVTDTPEIPTRLAGQVTAK